MVRARCCSRGVVAALVFGCGFTAALGGDRVVSPVEPAVLRSRVDALRPLQSDWQRVMKARGIPGMAIVVVHGDEVIYSQTLGVRDPVTNAPVTKDTMFYIASCTKSYLAMGMMILAEEGKIDLDAPVKTYLPRLQLADEEVTKTLTVRDLLSHAKGLDSGPAVFLDAFTGEITEDRYYYWLRQAEPTGAFDYTNVHYTLAGRVVDAVTGEHWKEFLRRRLFEPAGMYHTSGYASKLYGSDDAAIPSEHNGTCVEPTPIRKTDRVMHAAGGMGTSANDLARWLRLNLNGGTIDGHRIVAQASIDEMQRMQVQWGMESRMPKATRDGYGLGWFVGSYQGIGMLEHGGGYVGTAATISFMPAHRLGVAVVGNGSSALINVVAYSIYEVLLDLERNKMLARIESACERQHKRMKEWNKQMADNPVNAGHLSLPLKKYVGKYYNEHWGTVVVGEDGGALTLRIGDLPLRLMSTGKDGVAAYMHMASRTPGRFRVSGGERVAGFIYEDEDYGEVVFERVE